MSTYINTDLLPDLFQLMSFGIAFGSIVPFIGFLIGSIIKSGIMLTGVGKEV